MTFTDINASLTRVNYSSVAWGDYDGDSDLDLLITGKKNGVNPITTLYTNGGEEGFTENTSANLLDVDSGSVATGDYDGDDNLDLLITGLDDDREPITTLYTSDGEGGFTENTSAVLPGVFFSSVATGDYDGDDNLDLLITGSSEGGSIAKIYTGDGEGGFTEDTSANLPVASSGSVATEDYDGDEDLDLLITGKENGSPIAKIYTNNEGVFAEDMSANLPGVYDSSVAWGNYDGDDDFDLLITGKEAGGNPIAKIYTNDGEGGFTENTSANLPGVYNSSVVWEDYNGDDNLDLLITGKTSKDSRIATLYTGDGEGGFTEDTNVDLPGVSSGSVATGDYDGDSDPDLVITGTSSEGPIAEIYRNDNPIPVNNAPLDINLSNASMDENASIDENSSDGTVIGNLSTVDDDPNDTHTYTLLNDADGRFTIDGSQLQVANGNALDFEANGSHLIEIQTNDGTDSFKKEFTIDLNDVNEAPTAVNDSFTANSKSAKVIAVGSLLSNDRDPENDSLDLSNVGNEIGGTVAIDGDNVVFTPDGDSSTGGFDYTISDGEFNSSASVALNIEVAEVSSNDSDTIIGTSRNDVYRGFDGDDNISGEAGDDFIRGDEGNDSLKGGNGLDTLKGNAGNDRLFGEDNDDLLQGSFGSDILEGGAGSDRLYGNEGSDLFRGGSGDDALSGGAGFGLDTLKGEDGNDSIAGGGGDDLLQGSKGNDSLYGNAQNDRLYGSEGSDLFWGGSGDDILSGGVGFGLDTLKGEDGNDSIAGGGGDDLLQGGDGNDSLFGNTQSDRLYGNEGSDLLQGGSGDDILSGGVGFGLDTLEGEDGNDSLAGGDANDLLEGGNGNDSLFGNNGDDILNGGSGIDRLQGEGGNDTLTGGDGQDNFVFVDSSSGTDEITDFSVEDDMMSFVTTGFAGISTEGMVSSEMFTLGSEASEDSHRFIYNSGSGDLSYDADGSGSNEQVLLAQLESDLALTNADFEMI